MTGPALFAVLAVLVEKSMEKKLFVTLESCKCRSAPRERPIRQTAFGEPATAPAWEAARPLPMNTAALGFCVPDEGSPRAGPRRAQQ
jgi:hypothetical protein